MALSQQVCVWVTKGDAYRYITTLFRSWLPVPRGKHRRRRLGYILGRTTDVAKRTKAHEANPARAGLELEVIQPNLNYVQARAIEQAAMAYYHTKNTANKMNNQINGISPFNPKLGIYKEAAVGMLGYAWNQVSNEILYWTGN